MYLSKLEHFTLERKLEHFINKAQFLLSIFGIELTIT